MSRVVFSARAAQSPAQHHLPALGLFALTAALAVALVCATLSAPAGAQPVPVAWDGGGASPPSGLWDTNTNWVNNTAPVSGDSVTFNLPSTYTVTFNPFAQIATLQDLTVSDGLVTFTSNGTPSSALQVRYGSDPDVLLNGGGLVLGTSGNPFDLIADDELTVQNGSQLSVNFGSEVLVSRLLLGQSGNGTIVVDGAGSKLTTTTFLDNDLGLNGYTAELVFRNSARGDLFNTTSSASDVKLADSNVPGTVATLSVESDADLTIGGLSLASNSTVGATATLNISGSGSTVTQSYGYVTVGSYSGSSTGAINIGTTASGGTLTTAGGLDVRDTGTVTIGSGANSGTLNANGAVTIRGIVVVNNGALVPSGAVTVNGNGQLFVGSNGSASVNLPAGQTMNVSGGGFASFNYFNATNTNIYNIRDAGSRLEAIGADVNLGAQVNISNGGALFSSGILQNIGTISIKDDGSALTIAPGGGLIVASTIDVIDDGSLIVGSTTTLFSESGYNGVINIDGGTVDLQTIDNRGGDINFMAGSLSFMGDLTVGTGSFLGNNLTLRSDQRLTLSGTTTVDAGRTLALDGGTLTTGHLDINGTFNFIAGTLEITQAGATIAHPFITGPNTVISLNADNISLGDASTVVGFQHQGVLLVGSNTVTLNSAAYVHLGVATALFGGTINAPNGVSLGSDSNFQGYGTINSRVVGELGSVIEANGGALVLGDAASPAGFNFAGELRVRQHSVTLRSSSQAALGNLTTLGHEDGGGVAIAGTLNATNGLVVDFGDAITGYGTVSSTNTLAKRTIINGTAEGSFPSQPLTFTGYVKGVGTFNNVIFTGTFDPGLSPAILTVGNLAFSSTNTLIMELGGTAPGGGHDQIQSSGTLALDGTLLVTLINGFNPAAGNSFNLFDWAGLAGAFDTLQLPALSGSLVWDTTQLYTTGVLLVAAPGLPGDYNLDSIVDAADYVVWRKTGINGQPGYNTWRANFGQPGGSGAGATASANAAVPEPTSLALLLLAAVVGMRHRTRRRVSPKLATASASARRTYCRGLVGVAGWPGFELNP